MTAEGLYRVHLRISISMTSNVQVSHTLGSLNLTTFQIYLLNTNSSNPGISENCLRQELSSQRSRMGEWKKMEAETAMEYAR